MELLVHLTPPFGSFIHLCQVESTLIGLLFQFERMKGQEMEQEGLGPK
jgi:hypothetical protein